MAEGIPFVPLECQLNEKFQYIEAEFGLKGFAIVVKLFQRIYGQHGYYCEWNERVAGVFATMTGAGASVVQEVVEASVRERIFDGEMLERYGILTSRGIQRRFAEVARRRKVIFSHPEYVLPCTAQISEIEDISATSKVNEIKENIIEVEATEVKEVNAPDTTAVASEATATATEKELISVYGEALVDEYRKKFRKWVQTKQFVRAEMYSTIAQWLKQDAPVRGQLSDSPSSIDKDEVMKDVISKYLNYGNSTATADDKAGTDGTDSTDGTDDTVAEASESSAVQVQPAPRTKPPDMDDFTWELVQKYYD